MQDKLGKRYQFQKEVNRNGYFEGEIPLSDMTRLGTMLYSGEPSGNSRKVSLKFEFRRDEYETPMLLGQLKVSLQLECQRCLQAIDKSIELAFRLLIDADDELVQDRNIDTIYSEDGYIDIVETIEDELILSIPLVAMHEDRACNENWQQRVSEPEAAKRENPFAVLQQLKTTD